MSQLLGKSIQTFPNIKNCKFLNLKVFIGVFSEISVLNKVKIFKIEDSVGKHKRKQKIRLSQGRIFLIKYFYTCLVKIFEMVVLGLTISHSPLYNDL